MKSLFVGAVASLVLSLGSAAAAVAGEVEKLEIGARAPSIGRAQWLKGEAVGGFEEGRIYVVEFSATWCPPCRKAIAHLTELAREYAGRVTVISVYGSEEISREDPADLTYVERVRYLMKSMGQRMDFNVAVDVPPLSISAAWGVIGVPAAFVVGRSGTVVWQGDPQALDGVVGQVVAGTFQAGKAADEQKEFRDEVDRLTRMKDAAHFREAAAGIDGLIVAHSELNWLYMAKYSVLVGNDDAQADALLKWLVAADLPGFDWDHFVYYTYELSPTPNYDLAVLAVDHAISRAETNLVAARLEQLKVDIHLKRGDGARDRSEAGRCLAAAQEAWAEGSRLVHAPGVPVDVDARNSLEFSQLKIFMRADEDKANGLLKAMVGNPARRIEWLMLIDEALARQKHPDYELLLAAADRAERQKVFYWAKGDPAARKARIRAAQREVGGGPDVIRTGKSNTVVGDCEKKDALAQTVSAGSQAQEDERADPQAAELLVKGQRIDGLNNKGLLQNGANGAVYHDVITREDIERSGVTSLEELFRLIPQTSRPRTGMQALESASVFSGGNTFRFNAMGLRGFDSAQTVILINGRQMPRAYEGGGADLSRVPLAAIDRIEIMPLSGSAIYGAGAMGGAINIILRKEYAGHDLSAYFGATTDGGAGEYKLSYLDGRTFGGDDRGRITTTLSLQHRDVLRARDRDYLSEARARYTPENPGPINPYSGLTAYESFVLPASAGAPATIFVNDFGQGDLGIPGAPGARWATVPVGTSPADSVNLTPASFAATAGQPPTGQRLGRTVLYEPLESYSANAQVEYDLRDRERLSAYGEFTVGYNRKNSSFPEGMQASLGADNPINPFRNEVTPGFAGRAVTVFFDAPDVPDARDINESESGRAVIGLKGKVTERIEWSADGTYDHARNTFNSSVPTTNVSSLFDPYSAIPGEEALRNTFYPLLADHNQFPVSAATVDEYFRRGRYTFIETTTKEGNARLTGDVMTLPGGVMRASVFGKYQKWDFLTGQYYYGSEAAQQLIYGQPFDPSAYSGTSERAIWQGAAEVSIPLTHSFELQASLSRERHRIGMPADNFGGSVDGKQYASNGVLAGKWQISRDIAVRASYSEGFYPPDASSLQQLAPFLVTFPFFADPARGNTFQTQPFSYYYGGNPGLRPEQTKSQNIGLILTPRVLPGLALNVDYWRIRKTDAIVFPTDSAVLSHEDLYPGRIVRAAPSAQDIAMGWAGPFISVDFTAINAARTSTEGVDFRVRYDLETQAFGSFVFSANATFTDDFILQLLSTTAPYDTANGSGPLRRRGNASLSWDKLGWSATVSSRYVGHCSTNTTTSTASYPDTIPYDGVRIPAYTHWDLQLGYEVPREWLPGTRLTLGVNNLFNDKPAFVSNGTSFYNQNDDPRQRVVYFSLQKSF